MVSHSSPETEICHHIEDTEDPAEVMEYGRV